LLNTSTSGEYRRMDSSLLDGVRAHLATRVVGQRDLIDSMLICLVSEGHLLVEGMPGLAKTTAVKSLAEAIEGDYHRIQFTPDLLPSDLIGTDIYRHEKGEFEFRAGPLFHNILLADEVNRAPAKVQSALLEAMGEHQVTVGLKTYTMPKLFMVLATQNPIEQEGTYNLPEAQLDRFLMHVWVDYPNREEELAILALDSEQQLAAPAPPAEVLSQEQLFKVREDAAKLYLDPKLNDYIVDLRRGPAAMVPLRRLAARHHRPGALRQGARLAGRRGIRRTAPHPGRGARRAAPPHPAHLRGRGGGHHQRRLRQATAGGCGNPVIAVCSTPATAPAVVAAQ
jgi:MoxR-like ATPase